MRNTQESQGLAQSKREEATRIADNAFERSRRRAIIRQTIVKTGFGRSPRKFAAPEKSSEFELAFEDIAGLVGESTVHGLSPLPKVLAEAWRKAYERFGKAGTFESFSVRWVSGYWYLEGGMPEYLRAELLRACGEDSIMARSSTAQLPSIVARTQMDYPCVECGSRVAS